MNITQPIETLKESCSSWFFGSISMLRCFEVDGRDGRRWAQKIRMELHARKGKVHQWKYCTMKLQYISDARDSYLYCRTKQKPRTEKAVSVIYCICVCVTKTPAAKQRRNPCSGLPPVYQDLSTRYDWPVKNAIVDFPIKVKGKPKCTSHFR